MLLYGVGRHLDSLGKSRGVNLDKYEVDQHIDTVFLPKMSARISARKELAGPSAVWLNIYYLF